MHGQGLLAKMKGIWRGCACLAAAMLAALVVAPSVQAQAGLTVSGAKVVATMSPGTMFVHQMKVTLGDSQQAVNLSVTVSGMSQTIEGNPRPWPPQVHHPPRASSAST